MSRSKIKNGDPRNTRAGNAGENKSGSHQGGFSFRDYIREEWQATVFVAACVTIAHLGFNWLDAVDSYAFMAVGNRASNAVADAVAAKEPALEAVVVRIDEQTFRTRYRERSPLDRCVLSRQLWAIYEARPHIVVIDLDLSPADWARHENGPDAERERACQACLEATLAESDKKGIRTVVMEPFDSFDIAAAASVVEWQQKLERAGIRFGDAALPVSYGMTLNYFTDDRTLYAAARRDTVTGAVTGAATAPTRKHRKIDVSAYTAKLQPVLTSWTDTPVAETADYTDTDLTASLLELLPAPAPDNDRNRVVFFGAGYGEEDTYLTPVGKLYGVEVHAAAFASHSPPHSGFHLIALAIDMAIAFVFGMIIVTCWTQYFAWRCDERAMYGQLASIWVAIMLAGLLLAVAVAVVISSLLLSRYGLWVSPIPVAVGMLIESCMAGSVVAAVRRLHLIQPSVAARLPSPASIITLSTGFRTVVWVLALAVAVQLSLFH